MSKSRTHKVDLTEDEQFFYEHAGYSRRMDESSSSGKTRMAIRLAAAEKRMLDAGAEVWWEADDIPYDGDVPYDGPLWVAVLRAPVSPDDPCLDNELGSLGSIAIDSPDPESDPYARVVSAELADEYL
jgi:hypothetical protein